MWFDVISNSVNPFQSPKYIFHSHSSTIFTLLINDICFRTNRNGAQSSPYFFPHFLYGIGECECVCTSNFSSFATSTFFSRHFFWFLCVISNICHVLYKSNQSRRIEMLVDIVNTFLTIFDEMSSSRFLVSFFIVRAVDSIIGRDSHMYYTHSGRSVFIAAVSDKRCWNFWYYSRSCLVFSDLQAIFNSIFIGDFSWTRIIQLALRAQQFDCAYLCFSLFPHRHTHTHSIFSSLCLVLWV